MLRLSLACALNDTGYRVSRLEHFPSGLSRKAEASASVCFGNRGAKPHGRAARLFAGDFSPGLRPSPSDFASSERCAA